MAKTRRAPVPTFTTWVEQLSQITRAWDAEKVAQQKDILRRMAAKRMDKVEAVKEYHDQLLFLCAYPADAEVLALAEAELKRLAAHVGEKAQTRAGAKAYFNSGIAGSDACSVFSLHLVKWLLERHGHAVTLHDGEFQTERLASILNTGLDAVEQEMMHDGKLEWEHFAAEMLGHQGDRHQLLRRIMELLELTGIPKLKSAEFLFSELEMFVQWRIAPQGPSLTATRIRHAAPHLHTQGILKRMTLPEAILQGKPQQVALTPRQRSALVDASRGALASLLRETDPMTYTSVQETELFDMGRGVSVALFYMDAAHKMALQSYVGYLLFKNGIPCAYGGGWVVHREAGFGVNIFPPFRGGESANIVCQLLRLYALHFNVTAFTVDPYQIGYGNEDGIASGAFWFYYRLGFRPLEQNLAKLAEKEWARMAKDPRHRSSRAVLLQLAESTLRWHDVRVPDAPRFTPDLMGDLVTRHVREHHQCDRRQALAASQQKWMAKTGQKAVAHLHPILGLMDASGYLDQASAHELKGIGQAYALKHNQEAQCIKAMQQFPGFFDALVKAEQRDRTA